MVIFQVMVVKLWVMATNNSLYKWLLLWIWINIYCSDDGIEMVVWIYHDYNSIYNTHSIFIHQYRLII